VAEAIAAAAESLVAEVERGDGAHFQLARVSAAKEVALALYRGVAASGEPTALLVLLDEESPGHWEALSASSTGPGGSRNISIRPSVRGDWIVAIAGTAPRGAGVAVFDFAGVERRVPVEDGFYGFTTRAAVEPQPELPRTRFE
jgi:hypothetical protein